MGELTEFVSAGQNMHLTLWDRKKIGIFRVGISLPLNLARSRQGGREETAPWRLRMRQNCVWCQLRWRENRGIASQFFLIIVASGDRFAFCGKLRIFFLLGFGFLFLFFCGTLCWLWICVRFFFWIQLCFQFLSTVFGGAGDGFFQSSVEESFCSIVKGIKDLSVERFHRNLKKKKTTRKSQTVHALSQFVICIFRGWWCCWWWVSKKVNSQLIA